MPVLQPEAPSDVAQPFDWVLKAYRSAEGELEHSRLTGSAVSQSALGLGQQRAAKSGQAATWKDCGTVVIDPHPVELGDTTDRRLVVTRFRARGVGCPRAIRMVQAKHLSSTQLGKRIKSPLQCIAIPDADTPSDEDALIVCKNRRETIEIMFTPDCPEGECGL